MKKINNLNDRFTSIFNKVKQAPCNSLRSDLIYKQHLQQLMLFYL